MKININKQVCERCNKKIVNKDTDGIIMSFRGIEVVMCNECAIEFGELLITAAKHNQEENHDV